jgi:hypothetical protein
MLGAAPDWFVYIQQHHLAGSYLDMPHTGAAFNWFITQPLPIPHVQYAATFDSVNHPKRYHQEDEN